MSAPLPHRSLARAHPVTLRILLRDPAAVLADWRLRRRLRRELDALPAHLLRDIGLVDQSAPSPEPGRSLDHTLRGGPHW